MKKAAALARGDKVAIVSLSSGMLGEDFCRHDIVLGQKRLSEFGLETVFMPNALKGIDYLKEHPKARAEDLKTAFCEDSIKAVFCAIGGDDTYQLLPYLLEDREFMDQVKKHPKIFSGFSDTTINHFMFYQLGMITYYGPNFICDLAELGKDMLPYTKQAFHGFFAGHKLNKISPSDTWYEDRKDFSAASVGTERIAHKELRGFELLQGKPVFRGRLLGGCIESIYDILTGATYLDEKTVCEKYQLFPSLEEWNGKIMFLETCESCTPPDQLYDMLMELKNRGIFEVIQGIIVGKPQDEIFYEEYKQVYKEAIANKQLPVLYNINFGHAYPRTIVPYGIEAEVNSIRQEIRFLEDIVQ